MALPKVTIRGLQALLAVYEEQSFSRAALREHATQSGMSTQVKNLETALGTPLLVRGKGAMTLTPAGDIACERGRQVLKALFDIERRIDGLGRAVAGTIRLGIIPTLTRAVLPRALGRFRDAHPDVGVSVIEEYSFSLMRRVLQGELDCAAVPAGDVLSGLTASYLASDVEVLALRRDMLPGLAHLAPVRPADLSGLRLIMPSAINARRHALTQYVASHGVELAEIMDMDAMLGTIELVAQSDWGAVLPSAICFPDLDGGTRKLHPLADPPIRTDYVLVQKSEKALSEAAELLIGELQRAAIGIREDWNRMAGSQA